MTGLGKAAHRKIKEDKITRTCGSKKGIVGGINGEGRRMVRNSRSRLRRKVKAR